MNPPVTPEYVLGPDGKTIGFYDNRGQFFPSNSTTKYGDPYVGMPGMQQNPTLVDNFQIGSQMGNTLSQANMSNAQMNPLSAMPLPQVQMQQPVVAQAPQPMPVQEQQGVIGGIQNALNTAQQDKLVSDAAVEPKAGMSSGMRNSLIGLGANAVTGIAQTIAPDSYDQRVGMAKPGLGQFGNLQMTAMGASLGPVGAAVGFGVDAIKNTIGYFKNKQAFNVAENKADMMDWRNKMLTNQQPDYTGLAREGIEVKAMVPVELERSETIVTQDKGGYNIYGRTPENGPTHEQGGIPLELPEGALVFPKKYDKGLSEAMQHGGKTGDWSMMDYMKNVMKKNAAKAYEQGKPYSSGGKP